MKNNKLVIYKNTIINKIFSFFNKIFSRKKILPSEVTNTKENKNSKFIEHIQIEEDQEKLRLIQLKRQYENGEIYEEDISDEDIEKLCDIYEKETNELNADTERRKNHIYQMLKELKNS